MKSMQPDIMWKNSLILALIVGFFAITSVVSAQTITTPVISPVAWSNSDILGISGSGFDSGVWVNIYRANGETSTSIEHTVVSNTLISLSSKKNGLGVGDRVQVCKKINRRDSCTPFSDPISSAPSSSTPSQPLDPVASSKIPALDNIYWQNESTLLIDCTYCGKDKGTIYHSPGGSIEYLIPATAVKKWEQVSGTDLIKIQSPQNFDTTYQGKKVNVNINKGDYIRVCSKSGNCSEYKKIEASLAIPSTAPTPTPEPSVAYDIEKTVSVRITDLYDNAEEARRAINSGEWNTNQCKNGFPISVEQKSNCISHNVYKADNDLLPYDGGYRFSLKFNSNTKSSVCVRYNSNKPNRWHLICKKINRPSPPAKVYNNSVSVPSDTTVQANQTITVNWSLSDKDKSDSTWIGIYRQKPQYEVNWYIYNNGPRQAPNNWVYTSTCSGSKVKQILQEGRCDLNVGHIPSGVYRIRLFSTDDFNTTKMLASSNSFNLNNNDQGVNSRIQGFPKVEISFLNPDNNTKISSRNIYIAPGKAIKVNIDKVMTTDGGTIKKVELYSKKYGCLENNCYIFFYEKNLTNNEKEITNISTQKYYPNQGNGDYFISARITTTGKNCLSNSYYNESLGGCSEDWESSSLLFTQSENQQSIYSSTAEYPEKNNELSEDERMHETSSYPETDPEEVDY